MLAVSGIDQTIKIFSPDNRAQLDARLGRNINIDPRRPDNHPSIHWRMRRARHRQQAGNSDEQEQQARQPQPYNAAADDSDNENENSARGGGGGLASQRRMHDSYQIIAQNDIDRAGGNQEAYITVSGGPAFPLRPVPVSFAEWMRMIRAAEEGSEIAAVATAALSSPPGLRN